MKKCKDGTGVWADCKLRYIKVTQGCFSSYTKILWENSGSNWGGNGLPTTPIGNTTSVIYFKDPVVALSASSGCNGWCWTSECHYTWVRGGSDYGKWDNGSWKTGDVYNNWKEWNSWGRGGTVYGFHVYGNCGAWDNGSSESGSYKITIYSLGRSEATTVYDKISERGFKFADAGTLSLWSKSAYGKTDYCNARVYPKELDYLMPIS